MPGIDRGVPPYLQIVRHIRDQILTGALHPGDEVASQRDLAREWNVARATAAKALDALANEGLVDAQRGSGTYVKTFRANRRAQERYRRARETGLIYPPDEHAVIVAAECAGAPRHVAEGLELAEGGLAVRRQRVTYAGDIPVEISTSWWPATTGEVAPALLVRERIRSGTVQYVEQVTGRRAHHAVERLSAQLATADQLSLLGLKEPAAVMVVHHVVYDEQSRPMEFSEAVYPSDGRPFETTYPIG